MNSRTIKRLLVGAALSATVWLATLGFLTKAPVFGVLAFCAFCCAAVACEPS